MRKMLGVAASSVTTFCLSSLLPSSANSVRMSSLLTGCSKRNLGNNPLNGPHSLLSILSHHLHRPTLAIAHRKAWGGQETAATMPSRR